MTNLTDDQIEDAFSQIRVKFEKRKNETGIEILDNYETQWEATGSLSMRQNSWLENQLDESWKQKAASAPQPGDHTAENRSSDIIQFPAMDREMERRVDAMIARKLGAPGKTAVDLAQLDELEAAIDSLKRAVRSMR